jgi:hypothetical protein
MKEKLLNHVFMLDIQLFAEDVTDGDNGGENSTAENKVGEKQDKTVTLSPSQLESRLEREREKARQEAEKKAQENMSVLIAQALKEHDEKIKQEQERQKSFESMTEEQKQERLRQEKEEELRQREEQLNEQLKVIKISQAKEVIMTQYDEDNLPRRDIFSTKIAPFIAELSEEDKITVYNAYKEIIEDTKASVLKESLKQNPPKNGDGNGSSFASDYFIKQQNNELETSRNNTSKGWGKSY